MSRAPLETGPEIQDEDEEINDQVINQISTASITSKIMLKRKAEETSKDEELSKLRKELVSGEVNDPIYSLHNGIIFRGQRIFVPTSLRPEILK